MLPSLLDPLPDDLAAKVADADAWRLWQDRAAMWREKSDTDEAWNVYDVALRWWGSRSWSNFHLSVPPRIWIWSVGDYVYVRWDCRNVMLDGVLVWEAQHGEVAMSAHEFIAAVRAFDTWFISCMENRVVEVKAHWSRPEVTIDLDGLDRDQTHRSGMCSSCGRCDKANRKSQTRFECLSCGFCMNADANAARNIEARAYQSERLLFRSPSAS